MSAAMTQKEIYTVEEAAAYLRVHPTTIRRLIKQGKIKAFYVGDKPRIRQRALEEFMDGTSPGERT